jgi:hypothetical protein
MQGKIADFQQIASGIFLYHALERASCVDSASQISIYAHAISHKECGSKQREVAKIEPTCLSGKSVAN